MNKARRIGRNRLSENEWLIPLFGKSRDTIKTQRFYPFPDIDELSRELVYIIKMSKQPCDKDNAIARAQNHLFLVPDRASLRMKMDAAKEALKISPDCADAYVFMGDELIGSQADKIDLYRKGVAAARRALGDAVLNDPATQYYTDLNTKPFMRAMFSLAHALHIDGQMVEAIKLWEEMLKFDPKDRSYARWYLAIGYMKEHRWQDAEHLLNRYEKSQVAHVVYSYALCLFKIYGSCDKSFQALDEAFYANPWVMDSLVHRRKYASSKENRFCPSLLDETTDYLNLAASSWFDNDDTADWISEYLVRKVAPEFIKKNFPDLYDPENLVIPDELLRIYARSK